jgi:hypothetical protein
VTMKNAVIWYVRSCGSYKIRRFRGRIASIIRVTRISELESTLAVTSKPRKMRRNDVTSQKTSFFRNVFRLLVGKPERNRPQGGPKRMWVDDIKMDIR